jgi:hypothetical protein
MGVSFTIVCDVFVAVEGGLDSSGLALPLILI